MEQEQFKKEVLPVRERLLLYARKLLDDPDDAEDIVQEVFLKLWDMRDALDRYQNLPALAMRIAQRLCLNKLKTRGRIEGDLSECFALSDGITPYTQLERKENMERVMRIIDMLPGLQQAILRMRHVDGLEVEEIAGLTGSTPEAIRMNLSRARKRVRDQFFKM